MTQAKKIGKGFYQSGYGKGFKKEPIIRLINGKAYTKCSTVIPFETDLQGYIMVNAIKVGNQISFCQCGLTIQHEEYKY